MKLLQDTGRSGGGRFDESHESAGARRQQIRITSDGFVLRVVGIRAGRSSETKDFMGLRRVRRDACHFFNCCEKRRRVLAFRKLLESVP